MWTCTVNIKQYLTDDDDPETAQRVANNIADELERALQGNPALMGLREFAQRFRRVRTTCGVNRVLSDLYDYGDRYRVWFGL